MVRLAKHDRDRSVKLPADLVRELREQASRANAAWERARARERLRRLAARAREDAGAEGAQQAEALADGGDLYDALLDAFEPGMTVARARPAARRACAPTSCRSSSRCSARRSPTPRSSPGRTTRRGQEQLHAAAAARFRLRLRGRAPGHLDAPVLRRPRPARRAHDDARTTTRSSRARCSRRCTSAATGCTSRACRRRTRAPPSAHAPSLGLHESQSRFWENVIGRSHAVLVALPAGRAGALPGASRQRRPGRLRARRERASRRVRSGSTPTR